jgi:uncharacterized protein
MDELNSIIVNLKLIPHPEGGFYRETYRSPGEIFSENPDERPSGNRNYSTCIYYLLPFEAFSAFHRIRQDEIWHFYDGSPIILHLISQQGGYSRVIIGRNLDEGEVPQFVVYGGTLFAAEVKNKKGFSLAGCTVSPGFDFRDFELPGREELVNQFPQHVEIITRLTRL